MGRLGRLALPLPVPLTCLSLFLSRLLSHRRKDERGGRKGIAINPALPCPLACLLFLSQEGRIDRSCLALPCPALTCPFLWERATGRERERDQETRTMKQMRWSAALPCLQLPCQSCPGRLSPFSFSLSFLAGHRKNDRDRQSERERER